MALNLICSRQKNPDPPEVTGVDHQASFRK